jgi:hypothetical protein
MDSEFYSSSTRKTPAFLSTILDRPDFVCYVKSLTGFYSCGDRFRPRDKYAIDSKIKAALVRVCEDEEVRNRWYRAFYDRVTNNWSLRNLHGFWGNWNAIIAL